jgi:TIR domain
VPAIAISYRREDALDITGRIFDRLSAHYGRDRIFRDIDSMDPGYDFRDKINKYMSACDVLLVIVGPRWIGETPAGPPRIQQDADFVRHEVETGLNKGIPVIPVLVGRASMPSGSDLPDSLKNFVYRQAVTIDSGRDFDHHVSSLIRAMDRIFETTNAAQPATPSPVTQPVAAAEPPAMPATPAVAPVLAFAQTAGGPATSAPRKSEPSATPVARAPATREEQQSTSMARSSNLAKIMGGLLIAQIILRLVWTVRAINIVGFGGYFANRVMNSIEAVVLILLTAFVAYGTLRHARWARAAGLALCVYGIFNEIYYFSIGSNFSALYLSSTTFWTAIFIFGLLVYGFYWPGPKNSKTLGGN